MSSRVARVPPHSGHHSPVVRVKRAEVGKPRRAAGQSQSAQHDEATRQGGQNHQKPQSDPHSGSRAPIGALGPRRGTRAAVFRHTVHRSIITMNGIMETALMIAPMAPVATPAIDSPLFEARPSLAAPTPSTPTTIAGTPKIRPK